MRGEDIIVCTETWLGPEDTPPQLPGYVVMHFPRPQAGGGRRRQAARGGIAVYIRQQYAPHCTVWRTAAEGTHAWVRVDKAAGLTDTLLVAACYFPPNRNGNEECLLDAMAADIAEAQAEGLVLLAGDINARTATVPDFDATDSREGEHNAALADVVLCNQECMPAPPVCTARNNQDEKTNSRGRALIALCRATGMRICNGRSPGDSEGACTCFPFTGGRSLVDYFLACPNTMPLVRSLRVSPPEVGFDHCSLSIQLACTVPAGVGQDGSSTAGQQGPAPALHPGYRVRGECIPAFAEHLLQTMGNATPAFQAGAVEASSMEDLNTLVSSLEASIHDSLKAAGMPELQHGGGASRGPRREKLPTEEQQLKRQWRAATRHGNWELAQRLNAQLVRLARQRKRHDKAAEKAAIVLLARADRSAFWQKWKTRLRTEGPIAAGEFLAYFRELFGCEPPSLKAGLAPAAGAAQNSDPTAQHPDNAELNLPFTADEVQTGIEMLQQRKSVLGFLKLEFLKPVAPVLAPVLAELFNACARLKCLPHAWALGAITPLLKPGGNPGDCSSYRGITVGTLMAKLYATVINTRLTKWAEENCIRARGQAGFRKGHRTSDQIFILRTLVEQQRLAGTPLYVCFVDFQKAYDTVPRDQLWCKLEKMGIQGHIMDAIQALYADVPVCVRTGGELTPTFQSLMGVKQGCPLSPTLFGLYIDDFEAVVLGSATGLALPALGGGPAPPLLYADDLALMSTTREGLQRQLNILGAYADRWGLTVNVKKTKALVFKPLRKYRQAWDAEFTYKGEPVATVDSFRYLGIELHCRQPFGYAAGPLAASGRRALHAMRRRCAELAISEPDLQLDLFDSLVHPVLSYGAEVWASQFLTGGKNACESLHMLFLRHTLGVRAGTPSQVVLAEVGRFPLMVQWGKLTARFWSRLVAMDESRMLKQAFNLSLQMASQIPQALPVAHRPWVAHAAELFGALGIAVDMQAPAAVEAAQVVQAMMSSWVAGLESSTKCKLQHYVREIRGGISLEDYKPADYLLVVADRPRRMRLAQLRTGSHWLRVETGRWQRLERDQRVCPHCDSAAIEDESHLVFDCPMYAGLRQQFAGLFTSGARKLSAFFSQDPVLVAEFIRQCNLKTA